MPDAPGPSSLRGLASSRGWLDALLSACLAPRCAVCGQWLATPSLGAVCLACWQAVACSRPPLCATCGAPLAQSTRGEGAGCSLCAAAPLRFVDRAAALGLHDGTLRHIVHALKFGRRRGLAAHLGGLLRAAHADLLEHADAVVPVPLHRRRRSAPGLQPGGGDLPAASAGRCCAPCAARGTRPRRRRSTPAPRTANVGEAFALSWAILAGAPSGRGCPPARRRGGVSGAGPWRGGGLVLVDDVGTTGATLAACARVLQEAGAREVRALTAPEPCRSPRCDRRRHRVACALRRRSAPSRARWPAAGSWPARARAACRSRSNLSRPSGLARSRRLGRNVEQHGQRGLRQLALDVGQPCRIQPLRLAVRDARRQVAVADHDAPGARATPIAASVLVAVGDVEQLQHVGRVVALAVQRPADLRAMAVGSRERQDYLARPPPSRARSRRPASPCRSGRAPRRPCTAAIALTLRAPACRPASDVGGSRARRRPRRALRAAAAGGCSWRPSRRRRRRVEHGDQVAHLRAASCAIAPEGIAALADGTDDVAGTGTPGRGAPARCDGTRRRAPAASVPSSPRRARRSAAPPGTSSCRRRAAAARRPAPRASGPARWPASARTRGPRSTIAPP